MLPQPPVDDTEHHDDGRLHADDDATDGSSEEEDRLIRHSDAIPATEIDANEYVNELENDINIHTDVLNNTRSSMDKVTTSGLMAALSFASLIPIEILYARSLDGDTGDASWVIFLGEIILIFVALIIMKIGYSYDNEWYFDNLLCLLYGVSWFGLLWQVFAWNFGSWSFGYLCQRMPLLLVTICYFKQILPMNDAREYIHRFNAIYGLCYVVAPLITGFIAYFGSYRWVFGLNLALYTLLLIFNFRFIFQKFRKLENEQLTLVRPIYERYKIKNGKNSKNNENDTKQSKKRKKGKSSDLEAGNENDGKSKNSSNRSTSIDDSDDDSSDNNENDNDNGQNTNDMEASAVNHESSNINENNLSKAWLKSLDARFVSCIYQDLRKAASREYKKFYNVDLFLLVNCILQNGLMIGNLFVLLLFYTVYMHDKYDCTIFVSLVQLSVLFLFYVFGTLAQQMYIQSWKEHYGGYDPIPSPNDNGSAMGRLHHSSRNHDICNANVLTCIVGYLIRMFMVFIAYPVNFLDSDDASSYVITFWFYNAFYGAVWGMQSMAFDKIREEIEPKYYDLRKIDRSKVAVTALITAILVLSVGVQWDYHDSYDRLWYVQGVSYILSFILLIFLLYANNRKRIMARERRQKQANNQAPLPF